MNDSGASSLRVPPQNVEAEQSVLGGILLDNQGITKVLETLDKDDFYKEAHKKIFEGIVELFEKNEPTDLITLTNILKNKDQLEKVGGMAYLSSLAEVVPTAANIAYYAKIVKDKSILRKLIHTASEIIKEGYEERSNIEEFLDDAERSIFQISGHRIKKSFISMKEIIKDSFETIERLYDKKEKITGVPSGFVDLDDLTGGFQPSDLIIIAGRPSMGKTSFSLDIARHVSIKSGIPVAIFSLEMAKELVAIRMLCSEAKLDGSKLRKGYLKDSDWPILTTAAGTLSDARIFIDDSPALTALEMRAKARRLKAEEDIGLIILDYLQLMKGPERSESRQHEISEISRSLKALAKELDLPVIALSQLSRRVEDRPRRRPQLADLRESGAIEQDADVIIFIYREDVYNPENTENKGIAEIIIGKQRNGPIGITKLTFLDQYATFVSHSLMPES